jgi:hypothetical protein
MMNAADVTDGKPIAVESQYISGVGPINHLVAFYDIYGRKRDGIPWWWWRNGRCYSFILSLTPHETI